MSIPPPNMDKYMEHEQKEEDRESNKVQEKLDRHEPVKKQSSDDYTEDRKPESITDAATRQPILKKNKQMKTVLLFMVLSIALITTCKADCCLTGFPPRCVSNGLCNVFCCNCDGGCAFPPKILLENSSYRSSAALEFTAEHPKDVNLGGAATKATKPQ